MISLKQDKKSTDERCGTSGNEANRRDFLKSSAATAALTLAPGIMLYSQSVTPVAAKQAGEAVSSKNRWGMLIDAAKLTPSDIDNMVEQCHSANGIKSYDRPLTDAQWIRRVDLRNKTTGHSFSLPMMCQHCANPPCVDVCPTGASFKREDGIVLVDRHICIGCRYCMMACPYKARSFVHEHVEDQLDHAPRGIGTVEACNMCVHLLDVGEKPACTKNMPDGAVVFGDLNDPSSRLAKLVKTVATKQVRADLNLDTGVRYRNI